MSAATDPGRDASPRHPRESLLPRQTRADGASIAGSPADVSARRPYPTRLRAAFTLMEVLVVVGIITIFVGVIGFGFLRGSANSTVGLQASQSILVGLLTQARSQAVLSGREAAVLVHNDPVNLPERYLRFLVPVIRNPSDDGWVPLTNGVFLPQDCVVVPDPAPSGAWVESGTTWTALRSSALSDAGPPFAAESATNQEWLIVRYTPRGTTTAGNLVLASSLREAPGGTTPFRIVNPMNVRGVALTAYGQTRLINDFSGF